jgi:hypothetical protein
VPSCRAPSAPSAARTAPTWRGARCSKTSPKEGKRMLSQPNRVRTAAAVDRRCCRCKPTGHSVSARSAVPRCCCFVFCLFVECAAGWNAVLFCCLAAAARRHSAWRCSTSSGHRLRAALSTVRTVHTCSPKKAPSVRTFRRFGPSRIWRASADRSGPAPADPGSRYSAVGHGRRP